MVRLWTPEGCKGGFRLRVMRTVDDERTRSRLITTLFIGNALSSIAFIGVVTVSSLIAEQVSGSASLSGFPNAFGTIGTALGASILATLSFRIGRRLTYSTGFGIAAIGCALVVASAARASLPLLLGALAVLGFGRSVSQLSRFAAGDLRTPDRRASAISLIVWASTIGAVTGPLLIGLSSNMAETAGFDPLVGPVIVGIAGFVVASFVTFLALRPEPLTLTVTRPGEEYGEPSTTAQILKVPTVRLALAALITSQLVMVLVMTMTPLHIRANGGDLATIGIVMMAHTVGMFAIAPITGRLVDRYGARRFIGIAVGVLVVATLIAATATTADTARLVVGLFLLGVGWNFGFVAASAELQIGLPVADRLKIQGTSDSITWISGGLGAAASGVIVATTSYGVLALMGAVFALAPLVMLARTRDSGRQSL